ncbi:cellulase family glycosylhydrolase [Mycobacterium sp. BMJ-28]
MTGLFGDGGRGGNGGDGSQTGRLPALGGAGGTTTQWFGSHGVFGLAGNQTGVTLRPGQNKVKPAGKWFTDNAGKVIFLRGMNVVDIRDPIRPPSVEGFDDDDAAFLAANGFNVVRLGVDWELLQPKPGVYDAAYLKSLDQTVQLLAAHGVLSLLDLHQNVPPSYVTGGLPPSSMPFPASVFFDSAKNAAIDRFWANDKGPTGAGQLNEYAKMVQYLADHFNGNPDILGIEIMNEPLPGNQFLPSILGSSYHEAQQLTPFYDQVAAAIRSVNPDVTIFFEPSVLASATVPIRLGTVHDPNTALSFHDYAFLNLNGLVMPDVKGIANTAYAYAKAHNIPAAMTEFGSSSSLSSLNQTLRPADQYLLSWTEWSYANTGYRGIDGTVEWLVDDPRKPLIGDNVNSTNLVILTRPYAQVVAGTPTAMSLGENGVFHFSYTTTRADGHGRFATGSRTILSVPSAHYPNGYDVTIEGGHAVSARNAPKLVIVSDGAATSISVTITPFA